MPDDRARPSPADAATAAPTPPEAPDGRLDVVGIGSPLVDVLSRVSDDQLAAVGVARGSMALVDLATAEQIYDALGPIVEVSGGSAANTMVGVAALGGSAGFVGKVADDALGRVFIHDIQSAGVTYEPVVEPAEVEPVVGEPVDEPVTYEPVDDEAAGEAGREAHGTGRCLVLVTGDAERTMVTHLGVATTIRPDDVPEDLVARAGIVYLEGYLWDLAPAKEAMRRAMVIAHDGDGSVALSLSDPFCVERHRREFLELLLGDVDVLFGNEEEVTRLFGTSSLDDAMTAAEETGLLVAVTRGAKGSVVVTPRGPVEVPAVPVDHVVDTTGAGDLYAAGFLYGLTHGSGPEACARLGALAAGEVIGHLGARPEAALRPLAREAGLLP